MDSGGTRGFLAQMDGVEHGYFGTQKEVEREKEKERAEAM